MATLPPGWVSDYDGKRWFYIYEATNHTQYTFPKEGDEWPDFAGFSGIALDHVVIPTGELLPEERLESERQVKRSGTRETTVAASGGKSTRERTQENDDECGGTIDFCNFGYFGPGAWDDVASTAQQEEEQGDDSVAAARARTSLSSVTPPTTSAGVVTPPPASVSELSTGTMTFNKSDMSVPDGAGPQSSRTRRPKHPAETEPTRPFDQTADSSQAHDDEPQPQLQPTPDSIPMLDGREVIPPPLGRVPELVSESTALCAEETNPPPVELPDTAATWLEPVPVPNLENQYPVELPAAERSPGDEKDFPVKERSSQRGSDEHRTVTVQAELEGRPLDAYQQKSFGPPVGGGVPGGRTSEPPSRVNTRTDLPSQRAQVPMIPPKLPLEQEPPHTKPALSLHTQHGFRQSTFPTAAQISHVPSVLRPGPRRSSQPPVPSRGSTSPPAAGSEPTPTLAPSGLGGDEKYRAFQPSRPPQVPAGRRGHSQSLVVSKFEGEGFVMPSPDDHVRPLRLPQRTHFSSGESPPLSPPQPLGLTHQACVSGTPTARMSLRPGPHPPSQPWNVPSMEKEGGQTSPERYVLVNRAQVPPAPVGIPQRPSGFLKMSSEPSRSKPHVPAELSPPLHAAASESPSVLDSPRQADQTPAARTPDAENVAPEPSPKTFTSFADLDLQSPRTKKLKDVFSRQALKRIVKKDKEAREAEAAGPNQVLDEAESSDSAHAYIPPKGPREVAPEWSWGHAE